jgi:hypothetical protein
MLTAYFQCDTLSGLVQCKEATQDIQVESQSLRIEQKSSILLIKKQEILLL